MEVTPAAERNPSQRISWKLQMRECLIASTVRTSYQSSETLLLSADVRIIFFLMPPHVHTNFRGPPPGCGANVADF